MDLHPRFVLLNAGVVTQQLPQIVQLKGGVWDRSAELLKNGNLSNKQVQVLFLHTTQHSARNELWLPPEKFPDCMRKMQKDMRTVLAHCAALYPNLKIAYLTCDGLRYHTGCEPHVWREAFAFKWLIQSQIRKTKGTEFEGRDRQIPWLQWGPYIWNSTWDQSYFLDGVHPAPEALTCFVEAYWKFLKKDPVSQIWLFRHTCRFPVNAGRRAQIGNGTSRKPSMHGVKMGMVDLHWKISYIHA